MFKEQEPASRPQDVANPSNGVCHAGDRAQRERADDRIHAGLWQGDSLTRQTQEFHIRLRLASLPLGSLYHSWIGFQRVKFLHFRWIVVWENSRPVRRRPPGPCLALVEEAVGESFEWASDYRAP